MGGWERRELSLPLLLLNQLQLKVKLCHRGPLGRHVLVSFGLEPDG